MRQFINEHENGFLFAQAMCTIVGMFMAMYTYLQGTITNAIKISMALYVLMAIYTCWLFKKPHGNSLKYIGLLLSASVVYTGLTVVAPIEKFVEIGDLYEYVDNILSFLFLFSAILIAYVSGRLHKYKSNTVILIVAVIVLIVAVTLYQNVLNVMLYAENASQQVRFATHVASYNPPILVATFAIAYLTRYEPHIEAGKQKDLKVFNE